MQKKSNDVKSGDLGGQAVGREWNVDGTFPGRWFGRVGPTAWPPRSPDFTPLDFFQCGIH